MQDDDTYLSIAGHRTAETPRVKGSRFIGDAFPAGTPEAADGALKQVRTREPGATHWCYAFRMGDGGRNFRTNDAGEPSGTAGLPILRKIDSRSLRDVIVIVTRFFGGTKLGAGGLVRAYGDAASLVLSECRIVEHVARVQVRLSFGYPDTSSVMQVISEFDAEITASTYSDVAELTIAVRKSVAEAFRSAIRDGTAGRGRVVEAA